MLNYKYYRSAPHQLANRVAVSSRFAIGRRAGSNPRAFSREVAGSKSLLFYYYFLKRFSRKFLINRKAKNPLVDIGSNSLVT